MANGNFDTLTVTGNATVDSLTVPNNAEVGSLSIGEPKAGTLNINRQESGVTLQAWMMTLIPSKKPQSAEVVMHPGLQGGIQLGKGEGSGGGLADLVKHDTGGGLPELPDLEPVKLCLSLALQPDGGNVGIGTTDYSQLSEGKLVVNGDTVVNGDLLFKADKAHPADPGDIIFQNSKGVQKARIWSLPQEGSGLFLCTNKENAPNLSIDANGNVGIGITDTNKGKLVVHGGRLAVNPSALTQYPNGWGDGIHTWDLYAEGTIAAGKKGSLNAWVSNNGCGYFGGNVGIGTVNPSAKLEVNGDIKVTGDVILPKADCAEEFDIVGAEQVEPGTVMVINQDNALRPSEQAYDKCVAGVISGAGDLGPGITLGRQDEKTNRLPLALTGTVYCKVDAQYGAIEVGDLLTTSPTWGHAMKASDPEKVFGTVIGKALRGLAVGTGLIPILVALQ